MDAQAVKARLATQEGTVPYMYKCTGGKVTIGVGHALENADLACRLNWAVNGAPANSQQVQDDFGKVAAAAKGAKASTYAPLTSCRLAPADIAALLDSDIQQFEAQLRQKIPNWDGLPPTVQEALFDMGFNLGIGGLLEFKRLLAAVAAADWTTAAAESHRMGISDERNQETANLFLQAGAAPATAT
jgi:GH24 family phage-related lysozyme (muramidase)